MYTPVAETSQSAASILLKLKLPSSKKEIRVETKNRGGNMSDQLVKITKQLARLNSILNDTPEETPEQAWERMRAESEKTRREAEIERILAEYVLDGKPVPGDVGDDEIESAFARFKANTIFRLDHRGNSESQRISFTQLARPKVLELEKRNAPLKRDPNALTRRQELAIISGRER
jgi:hypothetical protein